MKVELLDKTRQTIPRSYIGTQDHKSRTKTPGKFVTITAHTLEAEIPGRGRRNSDNVKNKPLAETIFSVLLKEIMAWGAQQELPGEHG